MFKQKSKSELIIFKWKFKWRTDRERTAPVIGLNAETGTQTGCHNPISPRRHTVLLKKHEHK